MDAEMELQAVTKERSRRIEFKNGDQEIELDVNKRSSEGRKESRGDLDMAAKGEDGGAVEKAQVAMVGEVGAVDLRLKIEAMTVS